MKIKVLFTFIALWLCLGGVKVYAQTYIGTKEDLSEFAIAVNDGSFGTGTAYLIADINLKDIAWTPIGTADHPFQGQFEGWGHIISNLNVTGSSDNVTGSSDYAGLFGYIYKGSVRDVGIEGSTISGRTHVGGICGYLNGGEISSCYSNIAVSGTANIGGICGTSIGKIKNCWHQGNIEGGATSKVYVGGLVGLVADGDFDRALRHCYVINTQITVPNLSGTSLNSYFGLIVGDREGNPSLDPLECCIYNTKDVTVIGFNLGSGEEIIVGSQSGDGSPTLQSTVKGASPEEMKSEKNGVYDYTLFWNDNDNVDDDDLLNEYAEEISKNNEVWHIEQGYYPQLNSFYSKNKKITFNFTSTKQWLTIVPNGNYNVPAGVTAYQVTKIDGSTTEGGTVTLTPVSALYEGCPAIVHSTAGTPIETDGTTPTPLDSDGYSAWLKNNLLQGSPTSPDYIAEDEDATNYTSAGTPPAYTCYILQNGEFCIVHAGTMARGKAYLKIETADDDEDVDPNSGGKFRLVFQNEEEKPTNILSVDNSQLSDDNWYTLDGRKLESEPTEKGVYIVNGKKVMVQ
jgi:hypothetical protein